MAESSRGRDELQIAIAVSALAGGAGVLGWGGPELIVYGAIVLCFWALGQIMIRLAVIRFMMDAGQTRKVRLPLRQEGPGSSARLGAAC